MTTQTSHSMGVATRRRVRPAPLWWRDAAGIAAWVSGLFVVVLWLSGGGLRALTQGQSEALISFGRLTGLIAADLLIIQVFLMARVPWIERSYGQDELARRHRLVGFWSFNLMAAHVIFIVLGYTFTDHNDLIHETVSLVTDYAGMLIATAGTVAITLVTLTSIRAARRVLRYESWHLLHLYSYIGIALTIPHEVWTGSDFLRSSLIRNVWWLANIAAGVVVLIWRVGLPAARNLRHQLVVSDIIHESHDVVTVEMRGRKLDALPVQAGQFFIWRFLDGPGWTRGNPYSLSAAPGVDRIQITAKDLGDGSASLRALQPGTKVLIEGPYGRLTGAARTKSKVAMFACGIGITPMRALLEEIDFRPGEATLVYRTRNTDDVVFRADIDDLAQRRGVNVFYVTGTRNPVQPSWLPRQAEDLSDDEGIEELVPDLINTDVYVCGPNQWMDAVGAAVHRHGLPAEQLHMERFSW